MTQLAKTRICHSSSAVPLAPVPVIFSSPSDAPATLTSPAPSSPLAPGAPLKTGVSVRLCTTAVVFATVQLMSAGSGTAQDRISHETPAGTHHDMLLVPAGEFEMGVHLEGGPPRWDHARPVHTVYLDAFYIDKLEVTTQMYRASGATVPDVADTSDSDPPPSVIGVSWFEAVDYCEWAGLRLPTEAEWEKAARWADALKDPVFPYGIPQHFTGHRVLGVAWLGQWVFDWFSEAYYAVSPRDNPQGPPTGMWRVIRGIGCRGCEGLPLFGRDGAVPEARNRKFAAFRCALDADAPGSAIHPRTWGIIKDQR